MGRTKKRKRNNGFQGSQKMISEGTTSLLKPVQKIKKASPSQSINHENLSKKAPVNEKSSKESNKNNVNNEENKESCIFGKMEEQKDNNPNHNFGGVGSLFPYTQPLKNANNEEKKESCIFGETVGQKDNNPNHSFGGVIFICSGRTKQDCFRYKVMGFPEGKKELVLKIKPELNLFLYDYDAKLLYGIYKASSHGGVKLEPAAFNGGFGAQVRFKVDQDCPPLPRSIFGDAIKDNFDAKNPSLLFKHVLTVDQVSRLVHLFRQHSVQPLQNTLIQSVPPVPAFAMAPMTTIPTGIHSHLQQGIVTRPQNIQHILKEPPRDAASRVDNGIDYRNFGFLQKPVIPTSAHLPAINPPAPVLNPYNIRYETNFPHHYGAIPSHPLATPHLPPSDSRFYNDSRRASELAYGSRESIDKYKLDIAGRSSASNVGDAQADYNQRLQRPSTQADYNQRLQRPSTQADYNQRLQRPSTQADYNQRLQRPSTSTDLASLPVSSRYSFAGPTLTYR